MATAAPSRRSIHVCIAGNSKLRVSTIAILEFLSKLPLDSVILLRAGATTRPGWFERLVMQACDSMWLSYELVRPDLGDLKEEHDPRGVNWVRDVLMVGRCDVVLAFFDGETADPTTGTWHLVEKALDQHIPVYAYGWDGSRFLRIGEWDEHDSWGAQAPKV